MKIHSMRYFLLRGEYKVIVIKVYPTLFFKWECQWIQSWLCCPEQIGNEN
jgi:hypothetical protein